MPRRKLSQDLQEWESQGKRSFGLWLQARRIVRKFSLQQAADSVNVHRQTWIRWEQGRTKVPYRKLQPIAEALNVSPRRIFYLAGYKVPSRLNDAKHVLNQIHHLMLNGDMTSALEKFLCLYWATTPTKEGILDGTVPPNFARAVIFLDSLPVWLCEVVLECMQTRLERQKKEGVYVRFRNSLLNDCLAKLKSATPPIMDICPEITSVGSGVRF